MPLAYLTRVHRFNAGHRLHHPGRDDDWNWRTYGKCSYPEGHGHNYELEVTVAGEPHPDTGRVARADEIDAVIDEEVMTRLDHRNLNSALELRYGPTPTTEVLLLEIWDRLAPRFAAAASGRPLRLARLRIRETAKNVFEYYGPAGPASTP